MLGGEDVRSGLLEAPAAWRGMSPCCADVWRRRTVTDSMRQEGRESQDVREAVRVSFSAGRHGTRNEEWGSEIANSTPCHPPSNSVHTEALTPRLHFHIVLTHLLRFTLKVSFS